jgi:hypothetical protein
MVLLRTSLLSSQADQEQAVRWERLRGWYPAAYHAVGLNFAASLLCCPGVVNMKALLYVQDDLAQASLLCCPGGVNMKTLLYVQDDLAQAVCGKRLQNCHHEVGD